MTLFNRAIPARWARLVEIPAKAPPPTVAPGRGKAAPAEPVEEQCDPKVARACHQLGLVAQALEHPDVAERWQIEALRTAAKLKEYGLCARSASELAELCECQGRRDEAAAWSVLSLASLAIAPGRTERRSFGDGEALSGRVELSGVESVWRGATGGDLPRRLKAVLEGWLEDVPEHGDGTAGRHSAPDPELAHAQRA